MQLLQVTGLMTTAVGWMKVCQPALPALAARSPANRLQTFQRAKEQVEVL